MGDGEKRKWSCAINSIATIFHLSKMLWYFDSFFKVDICICFKSSRFHHNLMQTISFLLLAASPNDICMPLQACATVWLAIHSIQKL